jgi:hypothetical protein
VKVQLELGPAHRKVVEIRVAFVQAGQELHGVALAFPEGAPDRLPLQPVRLPPGDFELHTELRSERGSVLPPSVVRFHAGDEDLVRVQVPTESL